MREHVEKRTITLTYCATGEMTADIFTKAPPQPSLTKHNLNLGLLDHAAFVLHDTSPPDTQISHHDLDDEREETLGRSPSEQSPGEGWYC